MYFIWSERQHSGYVLSDALQAYAPTAASAAPTNVSLGAAPAVEEANGHRCRRIEAMAETAQSNLEHFHRAQKSPELRAIPTWCSLWLAVLTDEKLASGSSDRTIEVWDANAANEVVTLNGHLDEVRCVAWSRDGEETRVRQL